MFRAFILFSLSLFFSQGIAQNVFSGGTCLYFNSEVYKKKKVKSITLTEQHKYLKRNKVKITKPYATTKVLFDTSGKAICRIELFEGGADTTYIPEKLEFTGADSVSTVEKNKEKYYYVKLFDGIQKLKIDSCGNILFTLRVKHNVESASQVYRSTNEYDSQNRIISSVNLTSYLSWNYKNGKDIYDTVPLKSTTTKYIYENSLLIKEESKSWDRDYKEGKWAILYFYQEGILTKIEDEGELTKENPEKYLMLAKPELFIDKR